MLSPLLFIANFFHKLPTETVHWKTPKCCGATSSILGMWKRKHTYDIRERKTSENQLVVSTHLKHISQIGSFLQVGVKIKNIWNHQLGNNRSILGELIRFSIPMYCLLGSLDVTILQTYHILNALNLQFPSFLEKLGVSATIPGLFQRAPLDSPALSAQKGSSQQTWETRQPRPSRPSWYRHPRSHGRGVAGHSGGPSCTWRVHLEDHPMTWIRG